MSGNRASLRNWLEFPCWVAGIVLVGSYIYAEFNSRTFQRQQQALLADEQPVVSAPAVPAPVIQRGDAIGRLEIPRLDISVIVVSGDDDEMLDVAAGHLPDTALPWQQGNTAIAGHRDTFFRPLRNLRLDDELRIVTPHGTFTYRVRDVSIVKPTDVSVLRIASSRRSLTLITCYPFAFVGHAPKRYVVRADLVETVNRADGVLAAGFMPRLPAPPRIPRVPAPPRVLSTPRIPAPPRAAAPPPLPRVPASLQSAKTPPRSARPPRPARLQRAQRPAGPAPAKVIKLQRVPPPPPLPKLVSANRH